MEKRREVPWLVETAITFLDSILNEKSAVFEFGAGESTLWLLKRCGTLISVDHNPDYVKNGTFLCSRPYNKFIRAFNNECFDVVIVDGRDRVACVRSAIPKLKRGGFLVLDNSERPWYRKGIDLMETWNTIRFVQKQPDRYDFTYPNWTTSVFQKP